MILTIQDQIVNMGKKCLWFFIIFIIFFNCNRDKSKKDKIKQIYTPNKEEHRNLLKEILKKRYLSKSYHLYIEGKHLLPDNEQLYRVYSYNSRKNKGNNSLLIISRYKFEKGSDPIFIAKKYKGIIDEIHIIKLRVELSSHLLFISSHYEKQGLKVNSTIFWDLIDGKLVEKWNVTSTYDIDESQTYNPPEFHYWDGDDDGIQEVILTNPWPNKKAPAWKYRWAVFKWSLKNRVFIPVKGLVFNPYKEQNPLWVVIAIMEAVHLNKEKYVLELFQNNIKCDNHRALLRLLFLKKWKIISNVKNEGENKNTGEKQISIKVSNEKIMYKLMFTLSTHDQQVPFKWKVCKVRLFKILND
jgi:hypothetical protein